MFAEVAAASLEDLDDAVQGAQRAFLAEWRDLTPRKRADLLFALAQVIREHRETLAQLECQNIGKPISDARDEVELGARVFEYYAGAVSKFFGQTIPVGRGGVYFTFRQPMGGGGAVVPWDFSFSLACWETAPPFAAGKPPPLK